MYKMNFNLLTSQLLPSFLRKGKIVPMVRALVLPVQYLNNLLVKYRDFIEEDLAVTPQVCYLQRLLNTNFDKTERRIRVVDPANKLHCYIFLKEEENPLYICDSSLNNTEEKATYLYLPADFADRGYDFIVKLNGVKVSSNELQRIKSLLSKYKLVSKKYYIEL